MSAISPELATAVERYGRLNASEMAARAAAEREDVVARFPVEAWPSCHLMLYPRLPRYQCHTACR